MSSQARKKADYKAGRYCLCSDCKNGLTNTHTVWGSKSDLSSTGGTQHFWVFRPQKK